MHHASSPAPARPLRSTRLRVLLPALRPALAAALLAGCAERDPGVVSPEPGGTDSTPGVPNNAAPPDTATLRGAVVDLSAAMPVLRVAVAGATRSVEVTYWTDSTGGLRVRGDVGAGAGDTIAIPLPRVAAGLRYAYLARATGGATTVPDTLRGAFTAPPLPPDLQRVGLTASGRPTSPLTLLELYGPVYSGFVIVDAAGRVVWHRATAGAPNGSTRRANGNFVLDDAGVALLEVTPLGQVVHRLDANAAAAPGVSPHHDVVATPNNTLLFLSQDVRGAGASLLAGDAIWEWTPETGALAKRWSTFDALDPATDWTAASTAGDWVHANSLAVGPRGNVLISMRFLDQVLSISPDWSRVEWRLGGPGSTIALAGDARFDGQHTAQELPDGHVLLFDNGWDGAGGPRVSRLLELAVDPATRTATAAWEYRPAPAIFAPIVGSARRLPNGNTLGMFGVSAGLLGASGPVTAVEVDPAGRVAWSLAVTNVTYAYRATPVDRLLAEEAVPAAALPR